MLGLVLFRCGNDADGTPIVFDPSDTQGMNMSRTSSAEALKWIADECDAVKRRIAFPLC